MKRPDIETTLDVRIKDHQTLLNFNSDNESWRFQEWFENYGGFEAFKEWTKTEECKEMF